MFDGLSIQSVVIPTNIFYAFKTNSYSLDVARFMLTVAEHPGEWERQCVAITTKYTSEEETKAFQRLRDHMANFK